MVGLASRREIRVHPGDARASYLRLAGFSFDIFPDGGAGLTISLRSPIWWKLRRQRGMTCRMKWRVAHERRDSDPCALRTRVTRPGITGSRTPGPPQFNRLAGGPTGSMPSDDRLKRTRLDHPPSGWRKSADRRPQFSSTTSAASSSMPHQSDATMAILRQSPQSLG